VEFPLFEKKNPPNSISASPILLLLQTMKVVKYKFERNIQDVDYFGKDSSKTPQIKGQGMRCYVLSSPFCFLPILENTMDQVPIVSSVISEAKTFIETTQTAIEI